MIKRIAIFFLVVIALIDVWKQTKSWRFHRSQTVFKKALIESGISVD